MESPHPRPPYIRGSDIISVITLIGGLLGIFVATITILSAFTGQAVVNERRFTVIEERLNYLISNQKQGGGAFPPIEKRN